MFKLKAGLLPGTDCLGCVDEIQRHLSTYLHSGHLDDLGLQRKIDVSLELVDLHLLLLEFRYMFSRIDHPLSQLLFRHFRLHLLQPFRFDLPTCQRLGTFSSIRYFILGIRFIVVGGVALQIVGGAVVVFEEVFLDTFQFLLFRRGVKPGMRGLERYDLVLLLLEPFVYYFELWGIKELIRKIQSVL